MRPQQLALLTSLAAALSPLAGAQSADSSHVGYFYWEQGTTTALMLTSPSRVSTSSVQTVTPIIHVGRHLSLELDPVDVPLNGQACVDIGMQLEPHIQQLASNADPLLGADPTWGTGSRAGSLWGSIELQGSEGIIGVVCSVDAAESLSADGGAISVVADTVTGTWWIPTPETRILVPLFNSGQEDIVVRMSAMGSLGWVDGASTIAVPAERSRLVAFDQLFDVDALGSSSGALRFVVEGGQETLAVSTITVDDSTGLSVTEDLMLGVADSLEWNSGAFPMGPVGSMMGFPASSDFAGKLVVSNSSTESTSINLALRSQGTANPYRAARRTLVDLGAYESRVIDLETLFGLEALTEPQMYSLEIAGRLNSAELHASLWTINDGIDASYDFAFFYPLQPQAQRTGRLFVPAVDLSGAKTTQFSLRNTAKSPQRIAFTVHAPNGTELYESVKMFEGEEFQMVDLRTLRDSAIPDGSGRVLAADFVSGFVVVSGGPGKLGYNAVIDGPGGTCIMGSCDEVEGI